MDTYPFTVETDGRGRIMHIRDNRYTEHVDITDGTGRFAGFSHTLVTQDIAREEKPSSTPYNSLAGLYDRETLNEDGSRSLSNAKMGAALQIRSGAEGLTLDFECVSKAVSEWGAYLPLNFMSRKNGEWHTQFLVSSPLQSAMGHTGCLFTRPDGHHPALPPGLSERLL